MGCTFTQEQEPKSSQKQGPYIYMETGAEDLIVKTLGLYIYTGTGAKKLTNTRAVHLHGNMS